MRVYDRFLNLLTETDSFQSLQFTRNYHSVGSFEIHINKHLQGAEHFAKGNIISLGESHKTGIIVTREIGLDENGKESENIVVTGTTLCGLINRRITVPPEHTSHDRKSGTAEDVMKHYINNHFLNPNDPERKFPNFVIAPSYGRGEHIEWESRYKNIADELEKISLQTGLGWQVKADFRNKRFVFDVIESKDLTQGNAQGNDPVFFSPEFENVKSMQLTDSDNDLKTYGYVGGQGEGVERKIITIGSDYGWNRHEMFVDARDIGEGEEDEQLSENEIEQLLIKRGNEKLKEQESLFSLEAEIITPITRVNYVESSEGYLYPPQPKYELKKETQIVTTFQYEKDFNLGDWVDIYNKSWGVRLSTPIIEITEIHEQDGFRIEAVFGEDRPTLIDKLNRKFNEVEDIEKNENYYEYVERKTSKINDKISSNKSELEAKIDDITPKINKIWSGAKYPVDVDEVVPSKKLSECLNGWVLLWQRYVPGDGTRNSDFFYSHIHKGFIDGFEGYGMGFLIRRSNDIINKYMYIHDNKMVGQTINNQAPNNNIVLSGVYEW